MGCPTSPSSNPQWEICQFRLMDASPKQGRGFTAQVRTASQPHRFGGCLVTSSVLGSRIGTGCARSNDGQHAGAKEAAGVATETYLQTSCAVVSVCLSVSCFLALSFSLSLSLSVHLSPTVSHVLRKVEALRTVRIERFSELGALHSPFCIINRPNAGRRLLHKRSDMSIVTRMCSPSFWMSRSRLSKDFAVSRGAEGPLQCLELLCAGLFTGMGPGEMVGALS